MAKLNEKLEKETGTDPKPRPAVGGSAKASRKGMRRKHDGRLQKTTKKKIVKGHQSLFSVEDEPRSLSRKQVQWILIRFCVLGDRSLCLMTLLNNTLLTLIFKGLLYMMFETFVRFKALRLNDRF